MLSRCHPTLSDAVNAHGGSEVEQLLAEVTRCYADATRCYPRGGPGVGGGGGGWGSGLGFSPWRSTMTVRC